MRIIIQDISVPIGELRAPFACNLSSCRGACCTTPGPFGAPLLPSELQNLQDALPIVINKLPQEHADSLRERGVSTEHQGGHYTTVHNEGACCFVYYGEGGTALCALETAFLQGEISWKKPISCQLFPVRVHSNPATSLQTEYIRQCAPGFSEGRSRGISLIEFLKEPLGRSFGDGWYQEVLQVILADSREEPPC